MTDALEGILAGLFPPPTWLARHVDEQPLTVGGAIEWRRCADLLTGWSASDLVVELQDGSWGLGADLEKVVASWRVRHPLEHSGPKLSIVELGACRGGGDAVRVRLVRTEWRQVRALHEAMEDTTLGTRRRRRWLAELLEQGRSPVPNIATVHLIAETKDGYLLAGERSKGVHYSPSKWSLSLEEGLENADLRAPCGAFRAAAVRGLAEELAITGVDPLSVTPLSFIVEEALLNPALVAYCRLPLGLADLQSPDHPLGHDRQEFEAAGLRAIRVQPDALAALVLSRRCPLSPDARQAWHPTSQYRALVAMIHRFGSEETQTSLKRVLQSGYANQVMEVASVR